MANHPSAEKRNRQRVKRTDRNRAVKSAVRTVIKKARAAIETTPKEAAATVKAAIRAVDKAKSKGVVHKKAAARKKARLSRALHKATATAAKLHRPVLGPGPKSRGEGSDVLRGGGKAPCDTELPPVSGRSGFSAAAGHKRRRFA